MKICSAILFFKPRLRPARRAFTLVEMMVTVALLGFIVVGLTTMFVQAQRAFRAGVNQTDVLESGRAMADLLTRQLEETAPSQLSATTGVTNFAVDFRAWSTNALVGGGLGRTNILDSFYFLTRSNLTTVLNGYVVALTNASLTSSHFGTLYFFQTNLTSADFGSISNSVIRFQITASNAVNNVTGTNKSNIDSSLIRVADGIVHFRILPYLTNGVLIATNVWFLNPPRTNILVATTSLPASREIYNCTFASNAIPAYIDLELGVLESSTLAKLAALPAGTPQQNYLARSQTAGRIHLFRRHVALSAVDPQAYQ